MNYLKKSKVCVSLFAIVLLLSGCFNDENDLSNSNQLNSSSTNVQIALSAEAVYLSEVGSQFQLTAMLVGGDGVVLKEQPTFGWTSDAENTVKTNQEGLLTATGLGQANIQVTGGGEVRVIPVEINSNLITLNAQVRYADKEYNAAGFTGRNDYYKAVRFTKVDLIAENQLDVLQTTFTDAEGKFSFTGVLTSQQSISVYAKTNETLGLNLLVKDRTNKLYSVNKALDLRDLDNFTMTIPSSSQAAGAFNILDVFTSAAQFTQANTGGSSVTLTAFWQPSNSAGTYFCTGYDSSYCRQGVGAYIYSETGGDTDEFDDDVLYHEFAHYFFDAFSRDDSLGGCHLLSSKDLDLRLAWSEGWGDFFPAAVKDWLNSTNRSHLLSSVSGLPVTTYLDTVGNSAQIYIDIVEISQSRYSSAANEMAVAKILWSLTQRYGMPTVIAVLTDYLISASTQVNLESFWDGWLVTHAPDADELEALELIFGERLVFYRDDVYESDGVASDQRKAVFGESETHYLYSEPLAIDLDVIAFEVEAGAEYTLKTSGLTSGADTYMRVLNTSQLPLMIDGKTVENDDAVASAYYGYDSACGSSRVKNNGTALASKITFTAPASGTYYAEVRTTNDDEPYLSAGRYGTYDFQINKN